MHVKDKINVP